MEVGDGIVNTVSQQEAISSEELIHQGQQWVAELLKHHKNFHEYGMDYSMPGFDRWRENISHFLEQYAPHEAKRFEEVAWPFSSYYNLGTPPEDYFANNYGRACLGFLNGFIEEAQRGNIQIHHPKATDRPGLATSAPDQSQTAILLDGVVNTLERRVNRFSKTIRWIPVILGFGIIAFWVLLIRIFTWDWAEPITYIAGLVLIALGSTFWYAITGKEWSLAVACETLTEKYRARIYRVAGLNLKAYRKMVDH